MAQKARRWKRRPDKSNWGDFGDDDQLGRLNWLTPEKIRQGLAEAREGVTFCLSQPLNLESCGASEFRPGPQLYTPDIDGTAGFNYSAKNIQSNLTDLYCDDIALITLQYSTQWDALAHVGSHFDADGDGIAEPVYYNGYRAGDHVGHADQACDHRLGPLHKTREGARRLGIEQVAAAGLQGRGVLVDLHRHRGNSFSVITFDDLMEVIQKDNLVFEQGDILCLHTGLGDYLLENNVPPTEEMVQFSNHGLDGSDERMLDWIVESGVVAIAADNRAVEDMYVTEGNKAPGPRLPIHELCLFKQGILLGEFWYFGDLARWLRANDRSRFLLTAPPLRLPGAVGSPVTPIATV